MKRHTMSEKFDGLWRCNKAVMELQQEDSPCWFPGAWFAETMDISMPTMRRWVTVIENDYGAIESRIRNQRVEIRLTENFLPVYATLEITAIEWPF